MNNILSIYVYKLFITVYKQSVVNFNVHLNFLRADEDQIKLIMSAMEDITNKSCIKFKPIEKDEHAVLIKVIIILQLIPRSPKKEYNVLTVLVSDCKGFFIPILA